MVNDLGLSKINDALEALGGTARTAQEGIRNIKIIPTGIDLLDNYVFGVGGLPLGRAIEIGGKPSSGKSTLCQWLGGLIQKNGLIWWADVEGTMTKKYAKGSGLNLEQMIFPELGYGEDVLAKIKLALAINKFDAIFIDSIGATKSKDHSGDSMHTRLASARMWSEFWDSIISGYQISNPKTGEKIISNEIVHRIDEGKIKELKTIHKLGQKNTCLIAINHLMPRIGVAFGDKSRTSGGDKKDFVFSIRLRVSVTKSHKNKKTGELEYKIIKVENKKNKVGIPLRACQLKMFIDGRIEGLEKAEPSRDEDDGPSGINPIELGDT